MTNDIERKQKIYHEWLEEIKETDPRKRPDELSISDFSEQTGIGKDFAKKFLERKVKEGKATKRRTVQGTYYTIL